jgi:hypothetical protein
MKKVISIWSLTMLLVMCVGFSSCSSDDDEGGNGKEGKVGGSFKLDGVEYVIDVEKSDVYTYGSGLFTFNIVSNTTNGEALDIELKFSSYNEDEVKNLKLNNDNGNSFNSDQVDFIGLFDKDWWQRSYKYTHIWQEGFLGYNNPVDPTDAEIVYYNKGTSMITLKITNTTVYKATNGEKHKLDAQFTFKYRKR